MILLTEPEPSGPLTKIPRPEFVCNGHIDRLVPVVETNKLSQSRWLGSQWL